MLRVGNKQNYTTTTKNVWLQRHSDNVTHHRLLSHDQFDGGQQRLHIADKAAVDWLMTHK